jgi:hypothetical protein
MDPAVYFRIRFRGACTHSLSPVVLRAAMRGRFFIQLPSRGKESARAIWSMEREDSGDLLVNDFIYDFSYAHNLRTHSASLGISRNVISLIDLP